MRGMDFILYVKVMQLQERVNVIELISLYLLIPPYLVVVISRDQYEKLIHRKKNINLISYHSFVHKWTYELIV